MAQDKSPHPFQRTLTEQIAEVEELLRKAQEDFGEAASAIARGDKGAEERGRLLQEEIEGYRRQLELLEAAREYEERQDDEAREQEKIDSARAGWANAKKLMEQRVKAAARFRKVVRALDDVIDRLISLEREIKEELKPVAALLPEHLRYALFNRITLLDGSDPANLALAMAGAGWQHGGYRYDNYGVFDLVKRISEAQWRLESSVPEEVKGDG